MGIRYLPFSSEASVLEYLEHIIWKCFFGNLSTALVNPDIINITLTVCVEFYQKVQELFQVMFSGEFVFSQAKNFILFITYL